MRHLTRLEELNLSHNASEAFPAVVCSLHRLRRLRLRGCVAHKANLALPAELGDLTSLEELDLDENRIAAVPPSLGRLRHLVHLSMRKNRIQQVCSPAPCVISRLSPLVLEMSRKGQKHLHTHEQID